MFGIKNPIKQYQANRREAKNERRQYKLQKAQNRQQNRLAIAQAKAGARAAKWQSKSEQAQYKSEADKVAYENGMEPTTERSQIFGTIGKTITGLFGKKEDEFSELPLMPTEPTETQNSLTKSPLILVAILAAVAYFLIGGKKMKT